MKSLKILKKAAGIFAAIALVFGAVSCSSDDDGTKNGTNAVFKGAFHLQMKK